MKLYYRQDNGQVLFAIYDSAAFGFTHSVNVPMDIFEVDEYGETNKAVCADLHRNAQKMSASGEHKYFVSDGTLNSVDGWDPYFLEP